MQEIIVPLPEKIKLIIGPESYMITEPLMEQLEALEDETTKKKGDIRKMREMIVSLGLPNAVALKLGTRGFKAIFDAIIKEVKAKK